MVKELKPGEVLPVNPASVEIGIHHATLYHWAQIGKVAFVNFGGIMFIPVTEVERLKREKNQEAVPQAAAIQSLLKSGKIAIITKSELKKLKNNQAAPAKDTT